MLLSSCFVLVVVTVAVVSVIVLEAIAVVGITVFSTIAVILLTLVRRGHKVWISSYNFNSVYTNQIFSPFFWEGILKTRSTVQSRELSLNSYSSFILKLLNST